MGWLESAEVHIAEFGTEIVDIDPLHYSIASEDAVSAALVPAGGNIDYYTVEVRQNGLSTDFYEEELPGSGVVIHAVNNAREYPAELVNRTGGGACILSVGQVFEDTENGVRITTCLLYTSPSPRDS